MPSMMKAPHSKGAACAMCGGGACKMSGGGPVKEPAKDTEPRGKWGDGKDLEPSEERLAKPKFPHEPEELAKGGEPDGDEEISHGLGKELLSAFESKDHKKVMSALEACVLHHMSKGEE